MTNLLRRFQKPLMIVITLLVIVSFTVFYSRQDLSDRGSASHVGTIYGRRLTEAQFVREVRKYDLCQGLTPDLWQTLIQPAMSQEQAVENFVWNSLVLQQESDRLGIRPSDTEIEAAIKALPLFQTNGTYDSFKYSQFVQNALGPRGLTPETIEELVGSDIRFQRLMALLATTVVPVPSEIRSIFEQRYSKMETSVIRFDLAEFLKAQAPTDEDVKKAYDERKATLKTDEQRKVKYVAFTVPPSEKPLAGKERVDAFEKISDKAQEFMVAMTEKDAKFDAVAARLGAKVAETAPFPQDAPPAELDKSSKVAGAAFKLTKAEPVSDAVQTDKGYFLVALADIIPAREKTLDEAKIALVEDLKQERAAEALNLKATEVRNKIEAELKAGKSFADAATAAGVKAEPYTPFSLAEPPMKEKDGREVTLAAMELDPGQVSNFVPSNSGGGLLVYLAKRLPVDEKQFEETKPAIADEVTRGTGQGIFREWLKARRAAANIVTVYTPRI